MNTASARAAARYALELGEANWLLLDRGGFFILLALLSLLVGFSLGLPDH